MICLCNCDITYLRFLAYDWSIMVNEFIPAVCFVTCYTTPLYYASIIEAEKDMKNYTGRGGCFPRRLKAELDNMLTSQGSHNFSLHTKAEFNNCFIIHSEYF